LLKSPEFNHNVVFFLKKGRDKSEKRDGARGGRDESDNSDKRDGKGREKGKNLSERHLSKSSLQIY